MANIIVGDQNPVQQGIRYERDANGRGRQVQTWKVTDSADVATLVSALISGGYSYALQYDGQICTVEGTLDYGSGFGSPTTTPLTTIWERDIRIHEKDLLASNNSLVANGSVTEAHKKTILESLGLNVAPAATGLTSNALTVYTLMFNGVKSVLVYQPVIRRSKLCANSYATAESDTNMGKILTSAQMTSLEGAPGGLLYSLPASSAPSIRTDLNLMLGYLKMPARVQQQGDGRWQITQEWDYGEWSTYLYTAA
jgi:hypothetical protein